MPRPFVFLLFLATGLPAVAELGTPLIDDYNRSQIGVDGIAWTTTQHPDGRLLFGFDTVVEFDGAHWRSHPVPGGYAVRSIDVAADGRVWVAAMNEIGYLEPDGHDFTYHSLLPHLPGDLAASLGDVWHVFAVGKGAVFVTKQYVLRWTGRSFEWWHLPGARRLTGCRFEGRVYIGHGPTGLHQLSAEGLEPVVDGHAVEGASIEWIGRVGGQRVLGTTRGLRREASPGVFEPFAPAVDAWIEANVLTAAVSLDRDRIAIGSLHGGLIIVDAAGTITRTLDLSGHLPTAAVYSLYNDREGALWITSPTKVLRLAHEGVITILRPGGGTILPPRALASAGPELIAATEAGLLHTRPAAAAGDAFELLSIPRAHIYALAHVEAGLLLGQQSGLSLLRPDGTLTRLHRGGDVFALLASPDGRDVVAAEGTQLLTLPMDGTGAAREIGRLPDLPTSLAFGTAETVLAGTWARGLAAVGPSADRYHALESSLAAQSAATFVTRAADTVIALRGERVAWQRDGGQAQVLTLERGFHPAAVTALGAQAWVVGERRLQGGARRPLVYQLAPRADRLEVQALANEAFSRAGSPTAAHAQLIDGRPVLWLGGESSILGINTERLAPQPPPRAPVLRVTSNVASGRQPLVLPYAGNRLDVELAWPEPGRRPGLLVQTMLDGNDQAEWSEPQEISALRLANLQNGRYHLRVRFMTADGQVSSPGVVTFRVTPPWWRAPATLMAAGVLALAGLYGVVKLRLRNLRRRAARLERLVEQRTAQLTHASQAKTEFVAKMSHELRNPLNGIVASAHALEAAGITSDQRELVGTLRHCAQLLDALIGDVLDFSEIEAGRITLQPGDYDPVELVGAALAVIRPIAAQKGLLVESKIAVDTPRRVHGDQSRVQQVLLNLLGNAIKFSERGRITLDLRPVPSGLCFNVADEGPGIAADHRPHLFEQFARAPHARLQNIPGTGLGLAVCRQLVEQMGGKIWFEPGPTAGAVFTFRLPLALGGRGPTPPGRGPAGALPKRALVVEDLDYNVRAMVAMLSRLGCAVQTASTAAAALELIRHQAFDAVFLDCDLPDMSGPELARAILASAPSQSATPRLIATTAYADEATREQCLNAGMHAFIAKPVSPEKIRAVYTSANTTHLAAPPLVMPEAEAGPAQRLDTRLLTSIAPDAAARQFQVTQLQDMIRRDLEHLKMAAAQGDALSMRSAAHRLASHARFVGAGALAAVAAEIQEQATEEPELATDLIPAAAKASEELLEELEMLIAPAAAGETE